MILYLVLFHYLTVKVKKDDKKDVEVLLLSKGL